jgi:hypothetical protein
LRRSCVDVSPERKKIETNREEICPGAWLPDGLDSWQPATVLMSFGVSARRTDRDVKRISNSRAGNGDWPQAQTLIHTAAGGEDINLREVEPLTQAAKGSNRKFEDKVCQHDNGGRLGVTGRLLCPERTCGGVTTLGPLSQCTELGKTSRAAVQTPAASSSVCELCDWRNSRT